MIEATDFSAPFVVMAAAIVVLAVGGNIWLLLRETREPVPSSSRNTRVLRWIAVVSTLVVLATAIVTRPWYWGVVLATAGLAGLVGVLSALRKLWSIPRPTRRTSTVLSATSVVLGVALLGAGGVAGVLDGASLSSDAPTVTYHGGEVLARPVLYQVFWGPIWDEGQRPALREAVEFARELSQSNWARLVVNSGFGVRAMTSGGCWIDPTPPAHPGIAAASSKSGVFPDELHEALDGQHKLLPCPGSPDVRVPSRLPADAVVALWLPPQVPYRLGGVSTHGHVTWPGRSHGLVAAGLTGAFAYWGLPSCAEHQTCRELPSFAAPTYALSHEFLESTTDPYSSGWFSHAPLEWSARYVLDHGPPSLFENAPIYQGEVADLCEPGEPSAHGRVLIGRTVEGGPPVAAFYRPGTGCIT